MPVEVLSLGCRLNGAEAETMRGDATAAGLDDLTIVNTCAVTSEAVRRSGQVIRRAGSERPGSRIVVTGCAAEIEPARFAALPGVAAVLGNREKRLRETWTRLGGYEGSGVAAEPSAWPAVPPASDAGAGRVRAFVEVQNGCDHACTFCTIPRGRGQSRSIPAEAVIAAVRDAVAGSAREVVLTGVDLTAYGLDLASRPSLGGLVRDVLRAVPDLPRLRLSSLDAAEADPVLLDVFATEPRLMPHLHLSLQAGSDLVLKRMKRRHGREDAVALCRTLRRLRPGIVFGADLIAGFPTETEEMFRRSLDLVEECGLTYLHVFPYSARPGTPAARIPPVPAEAVRERAARLRSLGRARLAIHLAGEVGRSRSVLVEGSGIARTESFAPVRLTRPPRPGTIMDVVIAREDGQELLAA